MTVQLEFTERFFRPADVESIRRNYRGVQLRSFLRLVRNAAIVTALVGAAVSIYRHTQSDARFAIRHIEVTGAVHTPAASLDAVTSSYRGLNLFRLDIAQISGDLTKLAWVSRIEIEKALPDTLRIRIVERVPVALLVRDGMLRYVDGRGVAFAELNPAAGDNDLPIIIASTSADAARAVELIRRLRETDVAVYARISEVRPLLPHGFALFDRELGTTIYADERDLSSKWRDLYAIAAAESFRRGDVAYVDLRFNGRIVMKPARVAGAPASTPDIPTPITN